MMKPFTPIALAALMLAPVAARAQDTATLLRDLRSEDAAIRTAAVMRVSGPEAVGPLIGMLYGADTDSQPVVVHALRRLVTVPTTPEKRRPIADALLREAKAAGRTAGQRAAAMEYLSFIADDSHVPGLAAMLSEPDSREMARFVLMRMPSGLASDALADALPKADPAFQGALISALAQRGELRLAARVKPFLTATQPEVRRAAIVAMGRLGEADAAGTLWTLHTSAASEADRVAALDSYLKIAGRLSDAGMPLYRRLFTEAKTEQEKLAALSGIVRLGGQEIVPMLLDALRSSDAALKGTAASGLATLGEGTPLAQEVAVKVAAAQQGATPAQRIALLEILSQKDAPAARTALMDAVKDPDPTVRTVAWKGLTAAAGKMPRPTMLEFYHAGLPTAATDEERNAILAGIEMMADPQSLPVLRTALASGTGRTQILSAMLPIGANLAAAGKRDEAIAVYKETANRPGTARIGRESAAALRRLGVPVESIARNGYIANWWILGPILGKNDWTSKDAVPADATPDLSAKVNAGGSHSWKYVIVDDPAGMLDLNATLARRNDAVGYAYAEVTSSTERNVLLKIGSDDGAVVWLNGKKVYEFMADRAWVPEQDTVAARLSAGANRFLVKVLNNGADWAVSIRITDPSGTPLNLKQKTPDSPAN